MDIHQEVNLLDCPLCHGSPLLEEENGWCYYVMCLDCGCRTVEVEYRSAEEQLKAAQQAATLWNLGKVLSSTPGE